MIKKLLSLFKKKKPSCESQGFELYPGTNKIKSMQWGDLVSENISTAPELGYDSESNRYYAKIEGYYIWKNKTKNPYFYKD